MASNAGIINSSTGAIVQVPGALVEVSPGVWQLQAAAPGYVPATRKVETTAPLTGGGDLSANRTLAISAATALLPGSMSAADFSKLSGIEAGADVTDATNVAAAGAVMTSRTVSTTAPLTGGGALSGDLTLAIPAATALADGYMTTTQAAAVAALGTASTHAAGDFEAAGVAIPKSLADAADQIPVSTAASVWSKFASGTFGRSLVAAVDRAAALVTLALTKSDVGLGNVLNVQQCCWKGDLACAGNPNYPAANAGDVYRCSTSGLVGGASGQYVYAGQLIVALAANAGGTEASVGTSWTRLTTAGAPQRRLDQPSGTYTTVQNNSASASSQCGFIATNSHGSFYFGQGEGTNFGGGGFAYTDGAVPYSIWTSNTKRINVAATGLVTVSTGLEVSDLTTGRVAVTTASGRLATDGSLTWGTGILGTSKLAVGSGTTLTKAVVYTPTLTPTVSVAANKTATEAFTVTGLTTADTVTVNGPTPTTDVVMGMCRVTAADTLEISWHNSSGGPATPATGIYRVMAWRS